jgi:hypothetical protein
MANKKPTSDSQFKGVCRFRKNDQLERWSAQATLPNGKRLSAVLKTERDAAKAVDYFYIINGVEPVNILKRVK